MRRGSHSTVCGFVCSDKKDTMSRESQKHREFIGEPIGRKDVTKLPGIGRAYGDTLCQRGFNKAATLLGQFLVFECNEEMFKAWLHWICGANGRDQEYCYNGLSEWCGNHIW